MDDLKGYSDLAELKDSTFQSRFFRELAEKYGGDADDDEPHSPTARRARNMGKTEEENGQQARVICPDNMKKCQKGGQLERVQNKF
jgi:hypothetical protein